MEKYRNLTLIALNLNTHEKTLFAKEAEEVGFNSIALDSYSDLFKLLVSHTGTEIKGVMFSLDSLYNSKEVNLHEMINTIKISCKMVNRPVPDVRCWIRTDKIDAEIVRDALKSELSSIFYLPSSTHETRIQRVRDYFEGKKFVSPEVYELANPKKEKKRREDPNHIELTTRQQQVLKLIRERGASNKVIARTLKLSESTVKLHVGAILKKYGLSNRTQLALFSESKKEPLKEGERKSSSTNNLTINNGMSTFVLSPSGVDLILKESKTDYTNLAEIFSPTYTFDTTDYKVVPVTEVYPKQ